MLQFAGQKPGGRAQALTPQFGMSSVSRNTPEADAETLIDEASGSQVSS